MDFKSILNKLDSFSAPPKGVEAPKLADPIRLDEGTELRVLAGVTQLTESVIAEKMKVGDTKKSSTGGTITKTATGIKHTAGNKWDGEDHKDEPKKKVSKAGMTGAERQAQKAKDKEQSKASKEYAKKNPGSVRKYVDGKLVKEANKPDYIDLDKDGDKKEPMKKAAKEAKGKKVEEGKDEGKPGKNFAKIAKKAGEKYGSKAAGERVAGAVRKKVLAKEAAKPDFLDMDKDGDKKEPMKKAVADKKKGAVKESLTFAKALKIVKESQGEFQIDPMDKALWNWAERVGKSKFNESIQAQAFAAATYERMGGEWGLHKVIID